MRQTSFTHEYSKVFCPVMVPEIIGELLNRADCVAFPGFDSIHAQSPPTGWSGSILAVAYRQPFFRQTLSLQLVPQLVC